jgi:hypothetical protein
MSILYFGQFNPFQSSPLLFPLTPVIPQLSAHIVISLNCTDVTYFNIVDYHSVFLSLLPGDS